MVVAEVYLAIIIKATRVGPATALALVGEVPLGAPTGSMGPR